MEKSIDYEKSITAAPEAAPDFVTLKLKIPNFPSFDKSPQHYIDRYNSESDYKHWFDSQFPDISIYNILGYEDPVSVPNWIKNNAGWWAENKINDDSFVQGIQFLLENNIILISDISSPDNMSDDGIPSWVRNNAQWWSQDLISENEFITSLKFLIQEGIIIVR